MILILVAIIILTTLALWGANQEGGFFNEVICPVFVTLGFISFAVYIFLVFDCIVAGHQVEIINAKYDTEYTHADVFYAGKLIEEIHHLDEKKITER